MSLPCCSLTQAQLPAQQALCQQMMQHMHNCIASVLHQLMCWPIVTRPSAAQAWRSRERLNMCAVSCNCTDGCLMVCKCALYNQVPPNQVPHNQVTRNEESVHCCNIACRLNRPQQRCWNVARRGARAVLLLSQPAAF